LLAAIVPDRRSRMRGNRDQLAKDLYHRISSAELARDLPSLLDKAADLVSLAGSTLGPDA